MLARGFTASCEHRKVPYDCPMAINLESLGKKLRKCRDQLKETVDDVTDVTGISSERLNAMETGQVEPTGDEVLILADHFRCDFRYFISNEALASFEQTDTLYRMHGTEFSKSDRRAVQEFLYLCETEAFLMRELGREVAGFSFRPSGDFMKGHGEPGAMALRSTLGYPDNIVPRNVFEEFRRVGVHVFRRQLGNSNISGLFIRHPTAGMCALINYSEDVYRQRFSAAHEMAHAIFDIDHDASVSFEHYKDRDLREVRANRFASCFLVPPVFLRNIPVREGWSDEEARRWANDLRVSCVALGIALVEAGLVDADRGGQIQRLRIPKDAKVDPDLPDALNSVQRKKKLHLLELGLSDFYVGLCFDALKEGVISQGRLAEALLTNSAEIAEFASLYGRNLHVH
jgi:Zn-dependent peptidase ImmA (M78 family)/transcriptional regulator with XRE-family HTH domain